MELFLLSNGKLTDDAPLLGYAQPQLHAMIAQRGIRSAVLVPYAIIRGDHQQRAAERMPRWAIIACSCGCA